MSQYDGVLRMLVSFRLRQESRLSPVLGRLARWPSADDIVLRNHVILVVIVVVVVVVFIGC